MKICIPTRDQRGMASRVNEHFANAPYFTICDTTSGELQVVPGDRHSGHAHRTHHVHLMKSHDVDAVVCHAMGRRALVALNRAGVDVFVSRDDVVEKVIEAAREDRLDRLTSRDAREAPARARRGGGEHWGPAGQSVERERHGPGPGHRPRQFRRSK